MHLKNVTYTSRNYLFLGFFLLLFIYGYQIVRQIFMLPKNKVWRGIQEIPCQSVQLSIQSSPIHIFLIEKHLKFILDKNIAYDLRVCRNFYPVIWSSSRSLKENVQYSCSDHIFLMEKHWNFLLHKKIAYDLRVCHNFHPWLF